MTNPCLLDIYFGPHLPESLTTYFERLLQSADMVAMEFAASNGEQDEERQWNAISRGDRLPPTTAFSELEEFTYGLLERLFLTNKLVVFEKSPVKKDEMEHLQSLYEESRIHWEKREIDKAVQLLREYELGFASQIPRRDMEYALQLRDLMTRYTGKRILAIRGILHDETLPRILDEKGISYAPHLFRESYAYSVAEEVTRSIIQGEAIRDATLVRRHIEQDYIFKAGSHDYDTRLRVKERVLSMSQSDVENYTPVP
jgi:hypothetical protein